MAKILLKLIIFYHLYFNSKQEDKMFEDSDNQTEPRKINEEKENITTNNWHLIFRLMSLSLIMV